MSTTTSGKVRPVDAVAIGLLVLLCALWGFQQVAAKVAMAGGLPAVAQAAVRSGVAAALVYLWVRVREGRAASLRLLRPKEAIGPGLLTGVLFAVEFILLFPGLHLTTASRGVVFLYTAPFFTALGLHLFVPAERLRARQMAGLVIAFGGVAGTFADGIAGGGGSVLGDAMCAGAAMAWGANTVIIKCTCLRARSAGEVLFMQLGYSAPMLIAISALLGELATWPAAGPLAWAGLAYQTVVVAFASYLAWFWLVLRYPAGQLSGFTFLTPLFGILSGALLLHEHAGWPVLVGLIAIAAGLTLLNRR